MFLSLLSSGGQGLWYTPSPSHGNYLCAPNSDPTLVRLPEVQNRLRHVDMFCFQKHLILLIKGLCTGCSRLDRTEIITFTAMMKSAKLPQTVKTLSDGVCLTPLLTWPPLWPPLPSVGTLLILPPFLFLNLVVEDQKELATPVSPELRQKEVQMNFLNQLTSVFNPRTVPSPPISPQALVSSLPKYPHFHGIC